MWYWAWDRVLCHFVRKWASAGYVRALPHVVAAGLACGPSVAVTPPVMTPPVPVERPVADTPPDEVPWGPSGTPSRFTPVWYGPDVSPGAWYPGPAQPSDRGVAQSGPGETIGMSPGEFFTPSSPGGVPVTTETISEPSPRLMLLALAGLLVLVLRPRRAD